MPVMAMTLPSIRCSFPFCPFSVSWRTPKPRLSLRMSCLWPTLYYFSLLMTLTWVWCTRKQLNKLSGDLDNKDFSEKFLGWSIYYHFCFFNQFAEIILWGVTRVQPWLFLFYCFHYFQYKKLVQFNSVLRLLSRVTDKVTWHPCASVFSFMKWN